MPTIDLDDATIHYERSGSGPAVLFVHGMCGDAEVWADQAARLAARCTCVRYDRRGHTRSTRGDRPISVSVHADDAARLIRALDLAPCLLVGSSGGAAVGLDVARRHGHLLRGAVLSEPPLFELEPGSGEAVMSELAPALERAMDEGGPRAAVDAFFSTLCPGLWAVADEPRKDRYRANAEIGLEDLAAPALGVQVADLASVSLPVLVLAGEVSHPALRAVARRLADELPDARFVELEGSGHVTYAERPDDFFAAVSSFADELERRSRSSA